eukprot:gnl/TRDRNA2_/TRDRNA2_31344_c0_seq1.p1 gnl/TRDRNA2_/TRDRNA2_31344_c0~~gnl/TRDRNA2_/TRDRNA2_31344_c0_seq1.p1  ORF type:complete len:213 (-),score=17.37 gnl/TRDRNA2_/TRDRNA2_31344_c0_seq1:90-728(-)
MRFAACFPPRLCTEGHVVDLPTEMNMHTESCAKESNIIDMFNGVAPAHDDIGDTDDYFPKSIPWEPRSQDINEVAVRFDAIRYTIIDCTPCFELLFGPILQGSIFVDLVSKKKEFSGIFHRYVNDFLENGCSAVAVVKLGRSIFRPACRANSNVTICADCSIVLRDLYDAGFDGEAVARARLTDISRRYPTAKRRSRSSQLIMSPDLGRCHL